jgi:hypothetical protein
MHTSQGGASRCRFPRDRRSTPSRPCSTHQIRLKAQAYNLLFTVLIASSSGLWHAERWPSHWLLLTISGEVGPIKSPVPFFLTQANRIRAGKSSVLIHQIWTLSILVINALDF